MAITLANLTAERRVLPVPVGDQTLTITINARAVTPRFMKQWQEEVGEADNLEQNIRLIEHVVLDSDLVDADGRPVPLTREVLEQMDLRLLGEITKRINEAIFPNETSSPSSSGSS